MECDLWTHFLANSADIMQENSDTYFREEQQVLREQAPDWSEASVQYRCLNFVYTAAFLSEKKNKTKRKSCGWQSFYCLPAWN